MIAVNELTGGYTGEEVLKGISFQVEKCELFGILGPNGSGKTTLLKMISGALDPKSGSISLDGRLLPSYSPKQLARLMAVLPQHSDQAFPYSVKETVKLGRYAHQKGWFNSWRHEDEQIVEKVMEQTGITHLQEKSIVELSGGEKQRVFLAQALAQQPEILLLDEPTNHLDLSFQKELLDLLKKWTAEEGLTVVSIFHDLNLASLYCDRLLLMDEGKIVIVDSPVEVLKEERINQVFETDITNHPHPEIAKPQLLLIPGAGHGRGDGMKIDSTLLQVESDRIVIRSPIPLRTMSSGVTGAGIGWRSSFVNRIVPQHYDCDDHKAEMAEYLHAKGFLPSETVGMMTAVPAETAAYQLFEAEGVSIFVLVSAGNTKRERPRNINTWLFINGRISEEAFIQSAVTAAEAKMQVLQDLEASGDEVARPNASSQQGVPSEGQSGISEHGISVSGSPGGVYSLEGNGVSSFSSQIGISTDSICIAATQQGEFISYAGTAAPLGKLITKGIYTCTKEAILNYRTAQSSS